MSSRAWMRQRETPRVQGVTRESFERTAVDGVSDDGPAPRRQVHPNLMPPAGHQPAAQDGPSCRLVIRETFEACDAGRAVLSDDAAPAIGRIGSERQVDFAMLGIDASVDDGEIVL